MICSFARQQEAGQQQQRQTQAMDDTHPENVQQTPAALSDDGPAKEASAVEPKVVPPAALLRRFLDVCGNQVGRTFFIAMRFKHPVVTPNVGHGTLSLALDQCIAVDVEDSCTIAESGMVFYLKDLNKQKKTLECSLLKSFFPRQDFECAVFHVRTLYVVCRHNPFQSTWKVMRKNAAFHALVQLYECCVAKKKPFTPLVGSLMRHFCRNSPGDLFKFQNWYYMARAMCYASFWLHFRHEPTKEFGKQLLHVVKRSALHELVPNHPPRDFYTCQITLSDTEVVGLACRIVDDRVVYVSPMIVAYTKEWYLDTNHTACCFTPLPQRPALCCHWFPLLKDMETWRTGSVIEFYLGDFTHNVICVVNLLLWLSQQTAEPYKHMEMDLMQIYHILTGKFFGISP